MIFKQFMFILPRYGYVQCSKSLWLCWHGTKLHIALNDASHVYVTLMPHHIYHIHSIVIIIIVRNITSPHNDTEASN